MILVSSAKDGTANVMPLQTDVEREMAKRHRSRIRIRCCCSHSADKEDYTVTKFSEFFDFESKK